MELCKCSKDTHLLEMLPESPEPLTLTMINDHCRKLIFEYLEWIDMINIADSNKQLYASVCTVFNRKYKNAK